MKTVDFKNGHWKHVDVTYTAIGFVEKSRTLILERKHRYGIYYTDIRTTEVRRKLSKDKTIKLDNHVLDCSKVAGLENY